MFIRRIHNTDLSVTAVGLGTWAMGNDFFGHVDDSESIYALRAGIDAGINLIDTAPAYGAGHAEEVVGKAIKGYRDKVVVATKCGIVRTKDDFIKDLKPESVMKEIDDSLRRLNTDYIDLYQLHWPDPNTPIEETLEAIEKIKKAGKFRYLGVSNFTPEQMDEVRKITPLVSLQPQYSMLERSIEKDVVSYCQENGLGIISYGTLAGGLLTGKFKEIPTFKEGDFRDKFYNYYHEPEWSKVQKVIKVLKSVAREHNKTVAQVAINWTFSQLGITSVLVGAKSDKQARENAEACSFTLSLDDLQKINKAIRENLD